MATLMFVYHLVSFSEYGFMFHWQAQVLQVHPGGVCVCCVTICSWMCLDMNFHWQYLEEQPGHFVTLDGKVMGKHRGKHFNSYLSVSLKDAVFLSALI